MGLDINSPKGQITLVQERKCIDRLTDLSGDTFIETPKEQPAHVDGIIMRENVLKGVYEVKCRSCTLEQMQDWKTWLITADKLERGKKLSVGLGVPFYGILYLVASDNCVVWKLTNERGKWLVDLNVKETSTRATVNGGWAKRKNAYICLSEGTIVF